MSGYMLGISSPSGVCEKLFKVLFSPEMEVAYSDVLFSLKQEKDNTNQIEFFNVYGYDRYTILFSDDDQIYHIWVAFPESGDEYNKFIAGCSYMDEELTKR